LLSLLLLVVALAVRHWQCVNRDQTGLVGDVVLKLSTEMLDHGAHWHRRSVAQRADGATLNIVRN
jgi:hypothetical protein